MLEGADSNLCLYVTMSCRSWQVVQFDPLPVTFIKIVGTHNTANEVSPLLRLKFFTVDYIA